ncbi:MAG TPA: sugar phosphate isomerase/epimerase [Bryobacteraceae bacterium]|nr:sugar phosphate isomerase/epimerase [Bryobacteraceae bacterium]
MYTRRDFGKIAFAAVPLMRTVGGVTIGVQTYSYRSLPVAGRDQSDSVLAALKTDDAGEVELFAPGIEPPPGPAFNRDALRQWRLSTPMDYFVAMGKKFEDAGVKIHSYTMNYNASFTDDEIDKTFQQGKGLGTNIIASSTQVSMAKRLLAFAEKHKMLLAFHGHSNTKDANEFATPESFQQAIGLSKYARINLDIGHFFAAGYDPVAFIQEHHDHITHLHVKDRKKNDGPNMPWGEGDTPIKPVLLLLKDKKYPIPAFVEYEYRGTGTPAEEVKKCLDYMRQALA